MNGVRVSTRLLIPGWMSEDRSTHEHPRVRRSVALYSPIDYQTGAIEYRGHPHPSRLPLEPVCRGWWGVRIKNRLRAAGLHVAAGLRRSMRAILRSLRLRRSMRRMSVPSPTRGAAAAARCSSSSPRSLAAAEREASSSLWISQFQPAAALCRKCTRAPADAAERSKETTRSSGSNPRAARNFCTGPAAKTAGEPLVAPSIRSSAKSCEARRRSKTSGAGPPARTPPRNRRWASASKSSAAPSPRRSARSRAPEVSSSRCELLYTVRRARHRPQNGPPILRTR